MYKLKLIKGLSYDGVVSATRHDPFVLVDDKATADNLVWGGFFELISAETKETVVLSYNDMSLEELKAAAAERNIDTSALKKRADYVKALTECEADYDEPDVDNS